MDKDDDTTIIVSYKDKTYNFDIINQEKFNKIFVINKVMMKMYRRKMLFDEKFNMSIW